jgi:DNA-binding MarR family transcriptional regulator
MSSNLQEDREFSLWILLLQVRTIIYRARERETSQYGVTPEQVGALHTIHMLGNEATIAAIAKSLIRRPNSVSDLLHRIQLRGLITLKKRPDNQKPAIYCLTSKGEEVFRKTANCQSIYRAMSTLSLDEQENLGLYLRKMRRMVLKDLANESNPPWP